MLPSALPAPRVGNVLLCHRGFFKWAGKGLAGRGLRCTVCGSRPTVHGSRWWQVRRRASMIP